MVDRAQEVRWKLPSPPLPRPDIMAHNLCRIPEALSRGLEVEPAYLSLSETFPDELSATKPFADILISKPPTR
jgi:hypothetical protein